MACNREFELSLLLDGRLPAGKRSELLQEVDSCKECAALWQRMQAAHDLAVSLPAPARVSPEFGASLTARLRSGELPSAQAVAQRSTPWIARVGYTLSGAAAAAAVMIGVQLAGWQLVDRSTTTGTSTEIALADATPAQRQPAQARAAQLPPGPAASGSGMATPANPGLTRVRTASQRSPGIFPVIRWTPEQIASSVPRETVRAWVEFKGELKRLGQSAATDAWPQIEPMASDIHSSVTAVQWLDGRRALYLSQPVRDEIVKVQDAFEQLFAADDSSQRQIALARLQTARLEQLRQRGGFYIACCKQDSEFQADLADLVERDRAAVQHLLPRNFADSMAAWMPRGANRDGVALHFGTPGMGMLAMPQDLLRNFNLGNTCVYVVKTPRARVQRTGSATRPSGKLQPKNPR